MPKIIDLLLEANEKKKYGGFAFYHDKDIWEVCLFKSNNAYYGGSHPQMPKGHMDAGETAREACAREVSEETGIPLKALKADQKNVGEFLFNGEEYSYMMVVDAFVLDKKYPAKKNDEGTGVWIPVKDALTSMRQSQRKFLQTAFDFVAQETKVLKSQKPNSIMPKWRIPTEQELRLEYQLEYVNKKLGNLTGDRWPDVDAWLESASTEAEITEITPSMDDKMGYRSHTSSRENLRSLLKSYRSWPEFRNDDTIEKLYSGMQDGSKLPMPIVLDFGKGKMRIFGGNTRADVFRQIFPGKSYFALVFPV